MRAHPWRASTGTPIVFLARHGYGHTIAPHDINYRANTWALQQVGVTEVVAVATVGGIRADWVAGTLVVPDQIIDYTYGARHTYFEGADQPVVHVDFTWPYDPAVRRRVLDAAQRCGEPVIDGAVYGCTQGPRLETAAEIGRLEGDGCDLVGMTGMPEAGWRARLGTRLRVAVRSLPIRRPGKGDAAAGISLADIHAVLEATMGRVRQILSEVARG